MLLPALASAKFRAKVINCTSNYRQWTIVASLAAGDDPQGNLPSFPVSGGVGADVWDVSNVDDSRFDQIWIERADVVLPHEAGRIQCG